MKKLLILFLFPLLLAGCGGPSDDSSPLADLPDTCRSTDPFPENFPQEFVYPNSVGVSGGDLRSEDKSAIIGFLVDFCVKDTPEAILAWYKNKFDPQGYEYSQMETINYWHKGNKSLMLDLTSDLGGGYFRYSIDVRI